MRSWASRRGWRFWVLGSRGCGDGVVTRKTRESVPFCAVLCHFRVLLSSWGGFVGERLGEWIPAFAGMTGGWLQYRPSTSSGRTFWFLNPFVLSLSKHERPFDRLRVSGAFLDTPYGVSAMAERSLVVETMCLLRRMAWGSMPMARPSIWGKWMIGRSMGWLRILDAWGW